MNRLVVCTPLPRRSTHAELDDAILLHRQYADQWEEPCTPGAREAVDDLHVTMPSHEAIHVDLLLKVVDVNNEGPAGVVPARPYLNLEQQPSTVSWAEDNPLTVQAQVRPALGAQNPIPILICNTHPRQPPAAVVICRGSAAFQMLLASTTCGYTAPDIHKFECAGQTQMTTLMHKR